MSIPSKRVLNLAGFVYCAGLMSYALYAQHQLMLEPCPLCVLQRVAVIALGLAFVVAALHNAAGFGRYVYSVLIGLFGAYGIGVAGRHLYLQSLPADEVPSCSGMNLETMMEYYPMLEVLTKVFQGSGECAEIDWQFLGLSMPGWVLINVLGLTVVGIWNNLRR
ncbi:MAG: disulfide bond formation protein B [Woeseiaceae bacterium]|nr:disulfide bond formation protein B [Woeseiaceae bacterium]